MLQEGRKYPDMGSVSKGGTPPRDLSPAAGTLAPSEAHVMETLSAGSGRLA